MEPIPDRPVAPLTNDQYTKPGISSGLIIDYGILTNFRPTTTTSSSLF